MTKLFFTVVWMLLIPLGSITSCSRGQYIPENFLSREEQSKLVRETVYYSTKLPPNGNHTTKFDKSFDWYYDRAAQETELMRYYKDNTGTHYFLFSRAARSITPMREGIGGKLIYDKDNNLAEYEEVFRTWKMPRDSLEKRGSMLFERMVEGKDLSIFYSTFQGDQYIEFPSDRFSFDKKSRLWHDHAADSLR